MVDTSQRSSNASESPVSRPSKYSAHPTVIMVSYVPGKSTQRCEFEQDGRPNEQDGFPSSTPKASVLLPTAVGPHDEAAESLAHANGYTRSSRCGAQGSESLEVTAKTLVCGRGFADGRPAMRIQENATLQSTKHEGSFSEADGSVRDSLSMISTRESFVSLCLSQQWCQVLCHARRGATLRLSRKGRSRQTSTFKEPSEAGLCRYRTQVAGEAPTQLSRQAPISQQSVDEDVTAPDNMP